MHKRISQADIREEDKEKAAFTCHLVIFEYNKMLFGLVNAPATFQLIMDEILRPCLYKFVAVYLDNIIVFSKSAEEHKLHIELIKKVLKRRGLILNKKNVSATKKK